MEVLVVVAIIGILASIVIASFSGSRERARDAARISDLQQLSLNMALYRDANGGYPASLNDLVPDFISVLPTDPLGAAYTYQTSGGRYFIRADLELASSKPTNAISSIPGIGASSACSGATVYCVGR